MTWEEQRKAGESPLVSLVSDVPTGPACRPATWDRVLAADWRGDLGTCSAGCWPCLQKHDSIRAVSRDGVENVIFN